MTEINFLSGGFSSKKEAESYIKYAKRLFFISFAILMILIVGMGGVFLFNDRRISVSEAKQEQLEESLFALSQKETTYVLAKDRAEKAREVIEPTGAYLNIERIDKIVNGFTSDAEIDTIEVGEKEVVLEISTPNLSSLISVFDDVQKQDSYKNVVLNEFQYSPKTGFTFSLTFS